MIKSRVRKRDGRRLYDVRLRDPEGKVYNRTFDTKRAAEAYQDAHRVAHRKGAWVDPRQADLTFEEVAETWMAANPGKRPSARATDESVLRAHLLPTLRTRAIGSVTQPDVQRLVNAWSVSRAPRSVRRYYSVLHAVFAYAVASDWLGRSPCRNINLPPVKSTRRRRLDSDQVAAIADAMDDRYRAMVWVAAVLGWRWSEVAGLRVGFVDMLRGTATVVETLTRDRIGRPVTGAPKSAAGDRTLAIPTALADILAAHMAARGLTGADIDRRLFEAPRGGNFATPTGDVGYGNRPPWLRAVEAPASTICGERMRLPWSQVAST